MARYPAKENRDPYCGEENLAENSKSMLWPVGVKRVQGTSENSCRGTNIAGVISE
jgi:hypothetical protein